MKKLPFILKQANSSNVCVLAVTELGDASPALIESLAASHGFFSICSPRQYAGVALFVPTAWRFSLVSTTVIVDGRALVATFDLNGQKHWFAAVYLPTALDQISNSLEPDFAIASTIIDNLILSANSCHFAVLMGDLNCTYRLEDRLPQHSNLPLSESLHTSLQLAHFTDSFRTLQPANTPFTCSVRSSSRTSYSRLDYIYVKGFAASLVSAEVRDVPKSNHKQLILSCSANLPRISPVIAQTPRLPDLRRASDEQKRLFAETVSATLHDDLPWFSVKAAGTIKDNNDLFERLSVVCRHAAKQLPWSGGSERRSQRYRDLDEQVRQLREVRSKALTAHSSRISSSQPLHLTPQYPNLQKALQKARRSFLLPVPPEVGSLEPWLSTITDLIKSLRRRRDKQRAHVRPPAVPTSLPAKLHFFSREQTTNGIGSVIDPSTGKLECNGPQVRQLLYAKFKQQFDVDSDWRIAPSVCDSLAPLYAPKAISSDVYSPLIAPFTVEEVQHLCRRGRLIVAPGYDLISAGLLRVASAHSDTLAQVLSLSFNSCLRLRCFPTFGKHAIIHPILKKNNGEDLRKLSNIRPISLQPAITKLLMKGLAKRLGPILAKNRILHPAQEAYMPGGSSMHCVDTVLDVWEAAKRERRSCYNVFYDLRAAYDTVAKEDLLRALRRLSLPDAFVELIADSMTGLSSSVRSLHGETNRFPVLRSIRQGCPLSPLLFIIFTDAWHEGLDRNPLHGGTRDGFRLSDSSHGEHIASKGFADDTWITSETLEGIQRMNEFTHRFCELNHLQLNPAKTEFVGRLASGHHFDNRNSDIVVASVSVPSRPLEYPIRYCGVWICMSVSWTHQQNKLSARVYHHAHIARRHRLPVHEAVYFFNVFLMSRVEHILRHCICSSKQLKRWDTEMAEAISTPARSVRAFKREALAVMTGLILFADQYRAIRVAETFIRVNSASSISSLAAARLLHPRLDSSDRLHDAVRCAKSLRLSFCSPRATRSWCTTPSVSPTGYVCRTAELRLVADASVTPHPLTFGLLGAWGTTAPATTVSVSIATAHSPTKSAWAVVFHTLPGSAVTNSFSSSFPTTFPSEHVAQLASIAIALFACPARWNVVLVTPYAGAHQAITTYGSESSLRKRLRSCGRPVLALMDKLVSAHAAHGSVVTFRRSNASCLHDASFNRAASKLAYESLPRAPCLPALSWDQGEPRIAVTHGEEKARTLQFDDIRTAIKALQRTDNIQRWSESKTQKALACSEMVSIYRLLVRRNDAESVALCLRICTNIAHLRTLTECFTCVMCPTRPDASVLHLLSCPFERDSRETIRLSIIDRLRTKSPILPVWHSLICNSDDIKQLQLASFLCRLFETDRSTGLTEVRFMIGAWSSTEQEHAAQLTGINEKEFWQELALLLFNSVVSLCKRRGLFP